MNKLCALLNNKYPFITLRQIHNYKTIKRPKKLTENPIVTSTFDRLSEQNINVPQDWKLIRQSLMKESRQITPINVDAMTLTYCLNHKKYDMALKYLKFMEEEKLEKNLAVLGKYFKLFHQLYYDNLFDEKYSEQVWNMYKEVKTRHKILDPATNEQIILALSVTEHWQECFELLKEIRTTTEPNSLVYNSVIAAAFREKKYETGWQIFGDMLERNRIPLNVTYEAFLNACKSLSKHEDKATSLQEFFNYLSVYDLNVDKSIAYMIGDVLAALSYKTQESAVQHNGTCKVCNQKLLELQLTAAEYVELKDHFLERALIGKNIFCKSTPEELESFKSFVSKMEKFDVVIDGLNVAYSAGVKQSQKFLGFLLSSVVNHFHNSNGKVLVLGRKHMARWPQWKSITNRATTFLTEDISHDDPYLLYCALKSGANTKIISRDLMRSHSFLIKDMHYKKLFNRWLTHSRCEVKYVNEQGKVFMQYPVQYMTTPQRTGDNWHIPYEDTENGTEKNVKWLCAQLSDERKK